MLPTTVKKSPRRAKPRPVSEVKSSVRSKGETTPAAFSLANSMKTVLRCADNINAALSSQGVKTNGDALLQDIIGLVTRHGSGKSDALPVTASVQQAPAPTYNAAADMLCLAFVSYHKGDTKRAMDYFNFAMDAEGMPELVEALEAMNDEAEEAEDVPADPDSANGDFATTAGVLDEEEELPEDGDLGFEEDPEEYGDDEYVEGDELPEDGGEFGDEEFADEEFPDEEFSDEEFSDEEFPEDDAELEASGRACRQTAGVLDGELPEGDDEDLEEGFDETGEEFADDEDLGDVEESTLTAKFNGARKTTASMSGRNTVALANRASLTGDAHSRRLAQSLLPGKRS